MFTFFCFQNFSIAMENLLVYTNYYVSQRTDHLFIHQ